jgi:hypothetical protein
VNLLFVAVVGTIARVLIEKPSLTARMRMERWFEHMFPGRRDPHPTPTTPPPPAVPSLRVAA